MVSFQTQLHSLKWLWITKVGDVCTVERVEEPYDVKILEIK